MSVTTRLRASVRPARRARRRKQRRPGARTPTRPTVGDCSPRPTCLQTQRAGRPNRDARQRRVRLGRFGPTRQRQKQRQKQRQMQFRALAATTRNAPSARWTMRPKCNRTNWIRRRHRRRPDRCPTDRWRRRGLQRPPRRRLWRPPQPHSRSLKSKTKTMKTQTIQTQRTTATATMRTRVIRRAERRQSRRADRRECGGAERPRPCGAQCQSACAGDMKARTEQCGMEFGGMNVLEFIF
jgi:hypothetical protein